MTATSIGLTPFDTRELALLCASGMVRRWHQSPVMAETGQTLADHQGRCVQLLLALNPLASPALIRAVAFHDVGEFGAGDLSGPFKRTQPTLAAQHAAFETAVRQDICGTDPWLTAEETAWLKLVDRLEAMAFILLTRPWEMERKTAGWAATKVDLLSRAAALDCADAVAGLIAHLAEGVW
jgi:5'-deoxynucleotidase YfbR-like HD superfamily hydrolase